MTAHEANEMAKKAGQDVNIDKWLNLIREQAKKGGFSISGDEYIGGLTEQKLKSLGYDVSSGSARNEDYYVISWK